MRQMIYIHVPFCRHKCAYCDFVSGTNIGLKERYLHAVARELAMRDCHGEAVTLYMGGGTPSMLDIDDIKRLRKMVGERFDDVSLKEWTVECNPEDMNEHWLSGLLDMGVNRLSIGVQSLDDDQLRWMERRHNAKQAFDAVCRAKNLGFHNVSCDIIFGVPGDGLERTLQGVLELGVQHVSAYSLMMEEGSKITKKGMTGVDDDMAADMFRLIAERLKSAGFSHYEISNWAIPGYESLHNSGYWSGRCYIGLGPGAHSFDGVSVRRWNVGNTLKYCRSIENGEPFFEVETLSVVERFNEMVMLGLRRREGVDLRLMESMFGSIKRNAFESSMRKFEGLVICKDDRCKLTENGIFVSDMIMAEGFL